MEEEGGRRDATDDEANSRGDAQDEEASVARSMS